MEWKEKKARSFRRGVLSAAGSKTKEEIVNPNIINVYEIGQELSVNIGAVPTEGAAPQSFLDFPACFGTDS